MAEMAMAVEAIELKYRPPKKLRLLEPMRGGGRGREVMGGDER
jgi:hypothetical protein